MRHGSATPELRLSPCLRDTLRWPPNGGMASRFRKRVLLAAALMAILVAVLAAIVLAVFSFGALPLKDGTMLGGGCVEAVTEGWGPVTIGSYLIALDEGGFALVDAGMDPDAAAIRSALKDRGADPRDVTYIFIRCATFVLSGKARRHRVAGPTEGGPTPPGGRPQINRGICGTRHQKIALGAADGLLQRASCPQPRPL